MNRLFKKKDFLEKMKVKNLLLYPNNKFKTDENVYIFTSCFAVNKNIGIVIVVHAYICLCLFSEFTCALKSMYSSTYIYGIVGIPNKWNYNMANKYKLTLTVCANKSNILHVFYF